MAQEGRFTWRVQVEDADDAARALELTGSAPDAAELHHALLAAATQAHAHAEGGERVVADDEDGWELHAGGPAPTAKKQATKP